MPSLCRDCFEIFETHLEKCPKCASYRIVFHKDLDILNIAHIDCDAFYAAIHKRDDPNLQNKPVIVGGGVRGVVSTACYIARMKGVRSAMPMFQALKLCPEAVVIKPQIDIYSKEGRRVKALMLELTPLVESVSIDEAYMDLSGTERLHQANPAQVLARLAKKIESEIGISVSIGLSSNKFLAKTASDMDKPRGFFVLSKADVPEILWPREIGFLHGVGPATVRSFNRAGYKTIKDIANADIKKLTKEFGDTGLRLHRMANGDDNRALDMTSKRKSISTETTFIKDTADEDELWATLQNLAQKVGRLARQKNISGRTVNLKLKLANFRNITRQVSLFEPTQTGKTMLEAIRPLFLKEMDKAPFRLIGIGLSELIEGDESTSSDLLGEKNNKNLALEKAMDKIQDKYGKNPFIKVKK